MKADISQWREEAAYAYMQALSVEDLAWEGLRRNSDYQKDFARYARAADDRPRMETAMADLWGLRFRCTPEPLRCRPACPLDAESQPCRRPPDTPT